MTLAVFYDTETTGLPLWNDPSHDPRQPHIVQLAACLINLKTRETIDSMDDIVRPQGWEIPDDVAAIHGISTERVRKVGIAEKLVVLRFAQLYDRCALRIAHNEAFDARVMRIAFMRYPGILYPDVWKDGFAACTQALSTPILKLPPTQRMLRAGRTHYKSANLGEAYRHFTGRALANAHSAMADVKACMAVYFAIQDLKEARPA